LDASVFFRFGCAQLQLVVDRQCIQEDSFRAVLVEDGGANLDLVTLLAVASAGDVGIDVAIGV
jgi:hypothetical protein